LANAVSGGAAMFEDVRAYDAMGEHRTASIGDEATSAWLVRLNAMVRDVRAAFASELAAA
jgi:hypothetical protein